MVTMFCWVIQYVDEACLLAKMTLKSELYSMLLLCCGLYRGFYTGKGLPCKVQHLEIDLRGCFVPSQTEDKEGVH